MRKIFIRFAVLIGMAITINACSPPTWLGTDIDTLFTNAVKDNILSSSTTLTANIWADGNLTKNGEQWFKFTATASTQYIHVSFGTLNVLYVQVYDSSGAEIGSERQFYIDDSWTLTVGQEYYIKVHSYYNNRNGTYRIVFNALPVPPGIIMTPLTANTWADGKLLTSSDVQWFKFTATASEQYIHIKFGTLKGNLNIVAYDSNLAEVKSGIYFYYINDYISMSVKVGQEYYISVRSLLFYSSSGTYKIAFNTMPYSPGTTITQLTANTWANGNFPTSSGEQWFKFTATASTQYIYVSFGTLNELYILVYDSSGAIVGGRDFDDVSGSIIYISQTVTVGQEYYIRVLPYSSSYSGTYRIAFNTMPYPPGTTITPLNANAWTDGNLPTSSDEQWFKFTATASSQYIHVSFGTLNAMYVQVYDSSGAWVGGKSYNMTNYFSLTVTVGQEYYIRVRSYDYYDEGTYRIGFNTSTTPPPW